MRKIIIAIAILLISVDALACTSAIVSGRLTKSGRPLLWKHRDTGEENNKVERIPAKNGELEYVGLFNASDTDCREVWMGYNSAGFAIMNTASYNLKDDKVEDMDREGIIMELALRKCKTLNDFKILLDTVSKPIGVEANFGVIDANGNGGYFETCNYNYKFFDLNDAPDGLLTRTNYSYSGRADEGFGYIREANEKAELMNHVKARDFTPSLFTEVLSRTFYNSLLETDYTDSGKQWIVDQDFIPRRSSTATTVIEGVKSGENAGLTMMWIGLGYPPCSEIRAVFLGENGVPDELRGIGENGHSPLCDKVVARKHEVFPIMRGSGKTYILFSKLYNANGTGYCQTLIPQNLEYYKRTYQKLEKRRKSCNR